MFLKYLDKGLYTIPCRKASKATSLESGYSLIEWSERGIPHDLIDQWDKRFPISEGYGIALLCGKSSGIIGLDADTTDPELLAILPSSPCIKVGNTGHTGFFRYAHEFSETKKIKPQVKLNYKEEVEILSNGKYTLLPPSIHEDTKRAYIWVSEEDLYRIDLDELPELPIDIVERVEAYYAKKFGYAYDAKKPVIDLSEVHQATDGRAPHGAHDRIKKKTALLIEQELPIDQAVMELLEYDKTHHEGISYFEDRARGADSKADPKANALRFYANILSFINAKRIRLNEKPLECIYEFKKEFNPILVQQKIEHIPYPKARGVMGAFQTYCALMSNGNIDAISLGGALSLMSVVCANRFRTQAIQFDVRSNMYVLNLAKSGVGKEIPQSLIEDILSDTDLMGSASYKSGTSIIQDLPLQQERLNVIDECAAFLRSIASGEGFQQEINDILSQLFTKSRSKFAGFASVGNGAKFGSCWNPSVSILGSTTVYGFKKSVNRSMGEKGLMARFLTFWQYSVGQYKDPTKADMLRASKIKEQLKRNINSIIGVKKIEATDYVRTLIPEGSKSIGDGIKYSPIVIEIEDEALNLFKEYKKRFFPEDDKEESFQDSFRNRFAELAVKCALMDAISNGAESIAKDSMEWGIAVVEACWANVKGLYEETSAENQLEAESIKALNFIKKYGSISRSELSKLMGRAIPGKKKAEIFQELIDLGLAKKETIKDKVGHPKEMLSFV